MLYCVGCVSSKWNAFLKIVPSREDFLASWAEDQGVLVLSNIASFDITERRVWINDPKLDQILESQEILGFAESIEISSAESQGSKVFFDCSEELFAGGQPCFVFFYV